MWKEKVFKIVFQKWMRIPALAFATFCLTELFARYPHFTERIYYQRIFPIIGSNLAAISSGFPFSLDDLFYLVLILSVFLLIFLLLFRKITFVKTGKIVLNLVASVYVLFYLFWGFNYYREGLSERLGITEREPDAKEFVSVFKELVAKCNESYCDFAGVNETEIEGLINNSYQKYAVVLEIRFPIVKTKSKRITLSGFFAQAGISGYYGPFFSEVHVNKNVLPVEFPVILAHEKAHQFGIPSESEANFYAWFVCSQSGSKELQYSANLFLLRYFIAQGYEMKEYPEIISGLDKCVKDDFNRIRKHWLELRNEKIDKVASKVNDAYLKTNKVENGIEDYRGVVKHVMNFSLDPAFRENAGLMQF